MRSFEQWTFSIFSTLALTWCICILVWYRANIVLRYQGDIQAFSNPSDVSFKMAAPRHGWLQPTRERRRKFSVESVFLHMICTKLRSESNKVWLWSLSSRVCIFNLYFPSFFTFSVQKSCCIHKRFHQPLLEWVVLAMEEAWLTALCLTEIKLQGWN